MKNREKLLAMDEVKSIVPAFIKSNRNPQEFFRYMQNEDDTYKGRRMIIDEGMRPLLEYFEFSDVNDVFSGVKQYAKCELLGRGGFGEVYRYHNDALDMDFAVKIYDPVYGNAEERKEGERRFFREAKMLFMLSHSNIVRIYDAGRIDGKPFIRMEYVEGSSLDNIHNQYGIISYEKAVKAMSAILDGLSYAHENNIIHRDLKPSNVMVDTKVIPWTCKIIDFGISAFKEVKGYTRLTRTGEHIAGNSFSDPLLENEPSLRDPRSDEYSAAAIMYYLLCGRAPKGGDAEAYLKKSNSTLTDVQIKTIMKALSMDNDARYDTCLEFKKAIQRAV